MCDIVACEDGAILLIMDTMQKNRGNINRRRKIASVQKAIDIINLFNEGRKELGNSEIAKLIDVPTGTASGLIYTLKINHYLDQNPANRKYRLGLKLIDRAAVLLNQIDLRKIASPYLEEIGKWCGESVNLALRNEGEVVYIERLNSQHSLGIRSEIGKRAPIHSTALGKAIVAYLPQNEISNFLENHNFFPVTQYTITNSRMFETELEEVRARGYSVDEQENEIGGRCVAAPIFNQDGYPVAAISVSVPIQRLPIDQVTVFGVKLKEASSGISKKNGFRNI